MFEIIELLITNLWKFPLTLTNMSYLRKNILKLKWNYLLQKFETFIGPIENIFFKEGIEVSFIKSSKIQT
jgi:hypothetical protein